VEKITKKRKVEWLKMEYYCYFLQKKYNDAIKVVKELIQKKPYNKDYWIQLSSLYAINKKYDNSLSTLDISRIVNFRLNKKEWIRLINLLRYEGLPFRAAEVMSKKIKDKTFEQNEKNLNFVGDLYFDAKEFDKAIYFYKKAANVNNNKEILYKIAKIYMKQHNYKETIKYLKKALNGSEKHIGEKELLLGEVYYEIKNYKEAINCFQKAKNYRSTRKNALEWLKYLKNKD
jgi:tetratricopeptide (TPR) repeat protein